MTEAEQQIKKQLSKTENTVTSHSMCVSQLWELSGGSLMAIDQTNTQTNTIIDLSVIQHYRLMCQCVNVCFYFLPVRVFVRFMTCYAIYKPFLDASTQYIISFIYTFVWSLIQSGSYVVCACREMCRPCVCLLLYLLVNSNITENAINTTLYVIKNSFV